MRKKYFILSNQLYQMLKSEPLYFFYSYKWIY